MYYPLFSWKTSTTPVWNSERGIISDVIFALQLLHARFVLLCCPLSIKQSTIKVTWWWGLILGYTYSFHTAHALGQLFVFVTAALQSVNPTAASNVGTVHAAVIFTVSRWPKEKTRGRMCLLIPPPALFPLNYTISWAPSLLAVVFCCFLPCLPLSVIQKVFACIQPLSHLSAWVQNAQCYLFYAKKETHISTIDHKLGHRETQPQLTQGCSVCCHSAHHVVQSKHEHDLPAYHKKEEKKLGSSYKQYSYFLPFCLKDRMINPSKSMQSKFSHCLLNTLKGHTCISLKHVKSHSTI